MVEEKIEVFDIVPSTGNGTSTSFSIDKSFGLCDNDLKLLDEWGRNWKHGRLKKTISNLGRVHYKNNPIGNFYTLIWSWKTKDEARKYLELDNSVEISLKSKFCIKAGALIAVGQFQRNNNYQFYVKDKSYVIQVENSSEDLK